jgi:hypothetical protein
MVDQVVLLFAKKYIAIHRKRKGGLSYVDSDR